MVVPVQKPPLVCSQRLTLAVLAFLGKCFVYSSRVNLSVAILCMVRNDVSSNATHHDLDDNSTITDSGQDLPTTSDDRGEFDWDKSTQSYLLSMYFYGYIFTQIPAGWLSSRFGGRRVWGFWQLVSAICTLLTPISARTHIYLACAIRFILGFAAGVTFPSVHALLGRWAPPLERSKLVSYTFSGPSVGMVTTFALSGFLCEYGFDNGWASIFYLCGIFNLMWVIAWFYLTADSPEEHTRISERERNYIKSAIGKGSVDRKSSVPWVKMLTSGPVWAIITAHFCSNYTTYTLLTSLPMFMKEALKFDIKQKTLEEWRLVFYVCAAVALLGCIVYNILADGELQAWSVTKGKLEGVVNMDKEYTKVDDGHDEKLLVSDPKNELECDAMRV